MYCVKTRRSQIVQLIWLLLQLQRSVSIVVSWVDISLNSFYNLLRLLQALYVILSVVHRVLEAALPHLWRCVGVVSKLMRLLGQRFPLCVTVIILIIFIVPDSSVWALVNSRHIAAASSAFQVVQTLGSSAGVALHL